MSTRPIDAFVSAAQRPAADAELAGELERRGERAREAWPELSVSPDSFARYLGERVGPDGDAVAALGELETDDLYLACACAQGGAPAIAAFEAKYAPLVAAAARRTSAGIAPEALQEQLRNHLFVQRPAAPPAIVQYSGRGPLGAWVRVTATRVAIGMRRALQRADAHREADRGFGEQLLRSAVVANDPEIRLLVERCQDALRDALTKAYDGLEPRQRTLLRLALTERHSVRQLGRMYGVHHATAARWLRDAHANLITLVRQHLSRTLGVADEELVSFVRAVRSYLDLSLTPLADDSAP